MHINIKKGVMVLGIMTAAVLAVDNFRLRVTCRALENAVNYAVGGIHLDGVGGIFEEDEEAEGGLDAKSEVEDQLGAAAKD